MARAKRTDRTDARRRYRAQLATENGEDVDDAVVDGEAAKSRAATSSSSRTPSSAPGPRPVRPSFTGSARAAYHPINLREDIAILPRLLIHWSVLLSVALAVVGTGLYIAAGSSTTSASSVGYVASLLVSLFVGPPPFGAALLIGFMLPRATWLVGLIFGVIGSLCFTALVLAAPSQATAGVSVPAVLGQVWILGPVGTMIFSAGIAWYKRFLELLNPNRGQRAKAAQKPQQGRGNAPRNRLSGSSR